MYLKEIQPNEYDKQDFLLSQIALEVCRGRIKDPAKLKLQDFILSFSTEEQTKEEILDKDEKMQRSKKAWGAALGIDLTKGKK